MSSIFLEHVNVSATNPVKTAALLVRLFDWKIRWQGPALDDGHTVHVGNEESYIALYSPPRALGDKPEEYRLQATLNHIGVVVEDIDAVEQRVLAEGIKTHSHQAYKPGKRFYFSDEEGIEYEVVSYASSEPSNE